MHCFKCKNTCILIEHLQTTKYDAEYVACFDCLLVNVRAIDKTTGQCKEYKKPLDSFLRMYHKLPRKINV